MFLVYKTILFQKVANVLNVLVPEHTEHDLLDLAAYITEHHSTIDQSDILLSLTEQHPNTTDATSSGLTGSERIVNGLPSKLHDNMILADMPVAKALPHEGDTYKYVEDWLEECLQEDVSSADSICQSIVNGSPVKLLTGGLVDAVIGNNNGGGKIKAVQRKVGLGCYLFLASMVRDL